MKQFYATAANHMLDLREGESGHYEVCGITEVVLVLAEVGYKPGAASLQKEDITETIRFATSPDGLRTMAKNLNAYADAAEELAGLVRTKTDRELGEDEKGKAV